MTKPSMIHSIALATAFGFVAIAPALAQSGQPKLDACVAATKRAGDDPTAFKCDWKSVIQMAPGSALIGRYNGKIAGANGALTVLDGSANPAVVGIFSVDKRSGNTCTVKASGGRAADDALVVTAPSAPGCSIRIVSSGPNQVRVSSNGTCSALCGLNAGFDGVYQLRP